MPKFPEPPIDLTSIPPVWRDLPLRAVLWRIYSRGGGHPSEWNEFRHFGPVELARFDHHLLPPRLQHRAIFYAALDIPTCLAEIFQRRRTIRRDRNNPWLVGLRTNAPLRLLDLASIWPTRAGASLAIVTSQRARARRWSQAIYEAFPSADGLWYPSSMFAGRPCVALYERARDALPPRPSVHLALADPRLDDPLASVAADLHYRLIDRPR